MKTVSRKRIKPSFDPQLIANFQQVWDSTFHQPWKPIYSTDMRLNQNYDFFKVIVKRVKRYNESYDMTIVGDRGLGKSAFGLGAAIIINSEFTGDPKAEFPMNNVCFDVESWVSRTEELSGTGGVVILDEVGTEGSLSSRTSMSKGNRATADLIQLMRTDRIITIYISIDRERIVKRVRELTSVMGTPLNKLNDEDTNGYGLAIEADLRYRRTRPSSDLSKDDTGYLEHEISPLHYGPKGIIYSIIVPHPPVKQWKEYEDKRNTKLAQVRDAGLVAFDNVNEVADEIMRMKKEAAETKPKTKGN